MTVAGVDHAVLIPTSWDVRGNELAIEMARDDPTRFSAMCTLNPGKPEAPTTLEELARAGAKGLRQIFPPGMTAWLDDGTTDWLWPAAGRLRLPIMVWAPDRLSSIADVARSHLGVSFIIDHLNLDVLARGPEVLRAVERLLELAAIPNIAVKVSALPCHASDDFPYRSMQSLVSACVESFGPSRVMWGTDLSRLPCTYRQAVTMYTEHMLFPNPLTLPSLMGGAAVSWLVH
jgi:predicted TIM-barrel fold metal-dependent hydrolase